MGGQDADLSSLANGHIMLGTASGGASNLVMDGNEIMVRNGYTSAGTLSLQNDGGALSIGAHTTINKGASGEALKLDGTNRILAFITAAFTNHLSHKAVMSFLWEIMPVIFTWMRRR